jgi:hypothetical protein
VPENIEATGEALGLLFAQTLAELADGNVPMPVAGVMRERGADEFNIHVFPDGSLEMAVRQSSKPTVQDAAWLVVTDDDDEQRIEMFLCETPPKDPPFALIVVVWFDDDDDELRISKPSFMVPPDADPTDSSLMDALWDGINRGMSRHDGLQRARIVFGDKSFDER